MTSFPPTKNSGLFGILAPGLPGNPCWLLPIAGPTHTGTSAGSAQQACGHSSVLRPWRHWGRGSRGCSTHNSGRGSRPLGTASHHLSPPQTERLPPNPAVCESGHLAPSGTSPDLSPACPACLHKALSIGSGAGSHKPHPQLEMKPELWMLGAVCQPDSWHCHPETWASAPGVRPPGSGRVRLRVSPGQLTGLQSQAGAGGYLRPSPLPAGSLTPCPALSSGCPSTGDLQPTPCPSNLVLERLTQLRGRGTD